MLAGLAPSAWSQAAASASRPNPTTQAAYEAAIKCFVANGYGRRLKRDAGDMEAASRYEASAAASWEAAHVIAVSWNYPESRLTNDIDRTRERELPLMVRDAAYLRSTVATCRGLGLMPAR
jgi:hypothetical protein